MSFEANLKHALQINDQPRIKSLTTMALNAIEKKSGCPSEQALDYLTRACLRRGDLAGLRIVASVLPDDGMPCNANLTVRELSHVEMARGFVSLASGETSKAERCFQAVIALSAYFGGELAGVAEEQIRRLRDTHKPFPLRTAV